MTDDGEAGRARPGGPAPSVWRAAIRTLLVNHHRLERDELDEGFASAA